MSEKFPPRGFADPNQLFNSHTKRRGRTARGFWLASYKSSIHSEEYISIKEHNYLISQLEEKLATAEYDREAMASLWHEGKENTKKELALYHHAWEKMRAGFCGMFGGNGRDYYKHAEEIFFEQDDFIGRNK